MTGFSNADWAKRADPHFVYIAYRGDEPLYVGCSWNPAQRIYSHRRAEWIELMDALDIQGPWDKETALTLERAAIANLQPTHNRRGKRVATSDAWADAICDLLDLDDRRDGELMGRSA